MDDEKDGNYGTDPHHMTRVGDPETSKEAAERVDSAGWERAIHDQVKAAGLRGATIKEVSAYFGPEHNITVSPRFAPLRRRKQIFFCGLKRDRGMVWMDYDLYAEWLLIAPPDALAAMEKAHYMRQVTCPCCFSRLAIDGTSASVISKGTQIDLL